MTRKEKIQKAKEYTDTHPAKKQTVTIDAWLVRERFGTLSLFKEGAGHMWAGKFLFNLNQYDFPSVTFENSPKKVKIIIKFEE